VSAFHETLFQRRPGAAAAPPQRYRRVAKRVVRSLLPPIITDAYYNLRARTNR